MTVGGMGFIPERLLMMMMMGGMGFIPERLMMMMMMMMMMMTTTTMMMMMIMAPQFTINKNKNSTTGQQFCDC